MALEVGLKFARPPAQASPPPRDDPCTRVDTPRALAGACLDWAYFNVKLDEAGVLDSLEEAMKKARGRLLAFAAMICLTFCASASLAATEGAQEGDTAYPTRTIKFVVPYAPGGFPDTVARIIAQRLHEQMGQPCIVENRPGAGGLVAGDFVAKFPPDGYTRLLTQLKAWGFS